MYCFNNENNIKMNDSMIDVFSIVYDRIHTVSLIFALFHSFPYKQKLNKYKSNVFPHKKQKIPISVNIRYQYILNEKERCLLLPLIFPFILDKEENCRIFVILFISTRQGTCLVSWQAFYACPDASYGGFVPPCGVLMHPLPGW